MVRYTILVLITLLAAIPVRGAERVALVIGNAAYRDAPLRNAVNDARAMARALGEVGFEVISLENAGKSAMEQAIVRFAGRLKEDSSAVFYYAGHGVQVAGRNYLIPVDAKIGSEREIRIETVGLHVVLDEMGYAGNRMNIVILDACRNNPFERRLRGATRGLAAIDAARGTLIAYATAPGSVALDGDGANGIYTEELLHALRLPGLEVEEVFKQVRVEVARRTNQQQIPWESSSLTGRFVFNAKAPAQSAAGAAPGRQAELLYWQSVSASGSAEAYRAYLRRFPQGMFADLARIRLADLEGPSADATVAGVDASASQGAALLAKARPAEGVGTADPQPTERQDRPFVIAMAPADGKHFGACEEGIDGDAMTREAGRKMLVTPGYTYRTFPVPEGASLWGTSGVHSVPRDDAVLEYGRTSETDGVMMLKYVVGGTYCEHVRVVMYLYDVATDGRYSEEGSRNDVVEMTEALLADFAAGRGRTH